MCGMEYKKPLSPTSQPMYAGLWMDFEPKVFWHILLIHDPNHIIMNFKGSFRWKSIFPSWNLLVGKFANLHHTSSYFVRLLQIQCSTNKKKNKILINFSIKLFDLNSYKHDLLHLLFRKHLWIFNVKSFNSKNICVYDYTAKLHCKSIYSMQFWLNKYLISSQLKSLDIYADFSQIFSFRFIIYNNVP